MQLSIMLLYMPYPSLMRYLLFIISILSLGYLWLLWVRKDKTKQGLKVLPGPARNIIGGNEGQFSPLSPFMEFQKWAEQYGPIFQVKVLNQTIISINDPKMAKELFEKRGSKYSGRPNLHVGYELLSQNSRIVMTSNGPKHTAFRRQIHNLLSISRTKEHHQIQELESRQALQELVHFSRTLEQNATGISTPDGKKTRPNYGEVQSILRRYTLSVMMTLSFSHRIRSLSDPMVEKVFTIMDDISRAVQPGQYIADAFPVLRRLPYFLKPWEQETNRKVQWQWAFLHDLLVRTQQQMDEGIPNSGLIRLLLEQRQGMSEEERMGSFLDDKSIAYQSMTLMEAGSETTSIALMNFLLAMVLYPEVMRKGQDAVDAAVPASQLPSWDDLPSIPYVNQIFKEVMRWRPVIPMGVPHVNTSDDQVDGYYIPTGSTVFGNMWAMQHDHVHYPDPNEFRPERFELRKHKSAFESSIEADALDRDHYAFGWGRRICPGMHLAEASVLLLVARILWAFDITPAEDDDGNDIQVTADPKLAYDHTITSNPKVFPIRFRMRSDQRGKVIEDAFQDASKVWSRMNLDLFQSA